MVSFPVLVRFLFQYVLSIQDQYLYQGGIRFFLFCFPHDALRCSSKDCFGPTTIADRRPWRETHSWPQVTLLVRFHPHTYPTPLFSFESQYRRVRNLIPISTFYAETNEFASITYIWFLPNRFSLREETECIRHNIWFILTWDSNIWFDWDVPIFAKLQSFQWQQIKVEKLQWASQELFSV